MVGLDPHGALLLKERFKNYAKNGQSILLSTHSLNVAEEIADRIAIIDKGSLVTIGTLEDIKSQFGKSDENLERIFLDVTYSSAS